MSTVVGPSDPDAVNITVNLLSEARTQLANLAVDGLLTPADRAYLGSVNARLDTMARTLRERATPKPTPTPTPKPTATTKTIERRWTRKEAARLLAVHPNTLLNWHQRGLLVPKLDARGWRTYSTADIQRGLAILAHVSPDDLPGTE